MAALVTFPTPGVSAGASAAPQTAAGALGPSPAAAEQHRKKLCANLQLLENDIASIEGEYLSKFKAGNIIVGYEGYIDPGRQSKRENLFRIFSASSTSDAYMEEKVMVVRAPAGLAAEGAAAPRAPSAASLISTSSAADGSGAVASAPKSAKKKSSAVGKKRPRDASGAGGNGGESDADAASVTSETRAVGGGAGAGGAGAGAVAAESDAASVAAGTPAPAKSSKKEKKKMRTGAGPAAAAAAGGED